MMLYIRLLMISDIAFVSTPLNYFRQHPGTVRSRTWGSGIGHLESLRARRTLVDKCGLRALFNDYEKQLPHYVGGVISAARRPPHNKVPLQNSLELLACFARLDRRAFGMALRTLVWEGMAASARRLGLLKIVRKLKSGLADEVRRLSRGGRRLYRLLPRGRAARRKEMVTCLYREILVRDPVPEEIRIGVHRLLSGAWPVDQFRALLCRSAEYESIIKPAIAEIKATYSKYCFRDPTLREIESHLTHFRREVQGDECSLQVIGSGKIRNYLGIRPIHLEMDIVNQCNIRCIMCHFSLESISNKRREDISIDSSFQVLLY
jgi:hypothetical protein